MVFMPKKDEHIECCVLMDFVEAWHEFPGIFRDEVDFLKSEYGVGVSTD